MKRLTERRRKGDATEKQGRWNGEGNYKRKKNKTQSQLLSISLQDWLGTAGFDRLEDEDSWGYKWAKAYVEFAAGEKYDWLKSYGINFFPVVGWIELKFDSLITPDGREIPIEGKMTTKKNVVHGTAVKVVEDAGYTVVGGALGGLAVLNIFGLEAVIASQGYLLAGGAAVGGTIGLGAALYRKGKEVS